MAEGGKMYIELRKVVLGLLIPLLMCLIGIGIYPIGARISHRFQWNLPLDVRSVSPNLLAQRAMQLSDYFEVPLVADALLKGGYKEYTRQLLRQHFYQSPNKESFARLMVSKAVQAGAIKLADEMLSRIQDDAMRENLYYVAVVDALKVSDLQTAHQFYQRIKDPALQVLAAIEIGKAMLRKGQRQAGEIWLGYAALRCQQVMDSSWQSVCLSALASAKAESGDLQGASQLLPRIRQSNDRVQALTALAMGAYKAGRSAQALAWLKQAEVEVERIPPDANPNARYSIALAYAELGNFDAALQHACRIGDFLQTLALQEIAGKAAEQGQLKRAMAILPLLPEQRMLWMRYSVERDMARQQIAYALARQGRLNEAESIVAEIGDSSQIETKVELARICLQRDEREQAWQLVEDAYRRLLDQSPAMADPADLARLAGVLRQLKTER